MVVETMKKEHLSIYAAMQEFGINDQKIIERWEDVYKRQGLDKDEENKKGQYIRRERYVGSCQRSFYVGDVRTEDVKCKYLSLIHI